MGNFLNSCKHADDNITGKIDNPNLNLESNSVFDANISWLNSRDDRCPHCDRALESGNKFCVGCSLCIKHLDKKCYECIKNQKTLKWLDLSITEGPQINERFFTKNGIDKPKHEIFAHVCPACMFNEHCTINVQGPDLECGEGWAITMKKSEECKRWLELNDVV